ncbi:hypothetical protein, partial [Micromonospora sp. NPDC049799]|uniref:hypothetical protein n=1 Tax=Micromonospora sp. NPDC049799 TaxID=3154741 RepID=UPI0033D46E14
MIAWCPPAPGDDRTGVPTTHRGAAWHESRQAHDGVGRTPGRETFGASVYVAKKGGTIVTCASTSGYLHQ